MKKHLIAAAALATLSTAAFAQSVTVYGIIDQSVWKVDNTKSYLDAGVQPTKNRTSMENGAWLPSVLGFTGTEDLGGGLKAKFVLEGNIFTDNGSNDGLFQRQSWVGLSGAYGEFRAGKQIDALFLQQFINNVRQSHSNSGALVAGLAATNAMATGTGTTYSATSGGTYNGGVFSPNTLTYITPSVAGFKGTLQHAYGEVAGSTSAGSATAFMANYDGIANLALSAGTKTQKSATASEGTLFDQNFVGGVYKLGNLQFNAQAIRFKAKSNTANYSGFGTNSNGAKYEINELGVAYAVSPKLTAALNYVDVEAKKAGNSSQQDVTSISFKYALSKRTSVWTMASRTSAADVKGSAADGTDGVTAAAPYYLNNYLLSGATADSRKSQTGYGVGLTHTF